MRVCLVQPRLPTASESFIKAHDAWFGSRADATILCGDHFPESNADGDPLLSDSFLARATRSLESRFLGVSWETHRTRALIRHLAEHSADVVLAEYGVLGAAVSRVCHEKGIPLVVYFFGYDAYRTDVLSKWSAPYAAMFTRAKTLISVSKDMCGQLVRLGAPEAKIVYVPCGADVGQFPATDPGAAGPVFVAVGRFVAKKAPHLTLLSFCKVLEKAPAARLVMVGDGPLLDACKQMTRAVGLEDAVRFTGVMPHAQLPDLMQGARAFVQHSVVSPDGDSEGTPVAILEAGASGLPVVATRHAGIKDVVVSDQTGILVDEYDVQGMADAMLKLVRDPEMARRLGAAARVRIAAEFDQEQCLRRLEEILGEAAGSGRRRGE